MLKLQQMAAVDTPRDKDVETDSCVQKSTPRARATKGPKPQLV